MQAIFTALVAEFMTKEGANLVRGGNNLPVIGSLRQGETHGSLRPVATPGMEGENQGLTV